MLKKILKTEIFKFTNQQLGEVQSAGVREAVVPEYQHLQPSFFVSRTSWGVCLVWRINVAGQPLAQMLRTFVSCKWKC